MRLYCVSQTFESIYRSSRSSVWTLWRFSQLEPRNF